MENQRNFSIIKMSMETISDIIEQQALASQLVNETSGERESSTESDNRLACHHGVDGHSLINNNNENDIQRNNSSVVMVRHIIDEEENFRNQHHYIKQHLEQTLEQIQDLNNDQNEQQQSVRVMSAASPMHLIGTDVALNRLALTSNSHEEVSHLITRKQQSKLMLIKGHKLANKNINLSNSPCDNIESCRLSSMDELSHDNVDVALNHTQHISQKQQNMYQQAQNEHFDALQQTAQFQQQNQQQNSICSSHQETLSVIVQPQDSDEDSRCESSRGQLLSPELGNVIVSVVGGEENSLETTTYQTLTSVNDRVTPTAFSPNSSYATLTPLQPLPPISTMSEKFAYGGHLSSSVVAGNSSNSSSSSGVAGFSVMPHHQQNSLSGLSLSGLSGVQSPYSSYEKLASMSMSPSHTYEASSPTHTLARMVANCADLTRSPSSGCRALSPNSTYSAELHSPSEMKNKGSVNESCVHSSNQKQVCLSPVNINDSGLVGSDQIIVTGYDSPYVNQHAALLGDASSAGVVSSQLQQSPTLSPNSISAGSVSLNSPSQPGMVNSVSPTVFSLPVLNGSIACLSTDSNLGNMSSSNRGGLVAISTSLNQHVVEVSLTPSPPPNNSINLLGMQHRHLNQQEDKHHSLIHQIGDKSTNNSSNAERNMTLNLDSSNANFSRIETQTNQLSQLSPVTAQNVSKPNNSSTNDMEEINTKELAQRISAELKRYSIPQAIFAQRVLCRSQGTLSDLLRNPKPWSKLKSGRETFRRMFKWLQEPEFQRMSALRMAAAQLPHRNTQVTSSSISGNTVAVGLMSSENGMNKCLILLTGLFEKK